MACGLGRFRRFEKALALAVGQPVDLEPMLTFYGSGDFHHVSLALLRRLTVPVTLLVIDKHPDWMRWLPFLHCGTWVDHAGRLPLVERVFHVGGDLDFDNAYRWMAPWSFLRSGRYVVFPAVRHFERWPWSCVTHEPLRRRDDTNLCRERMDELLGPHRADLVRRPLYISLDKDVLVEQDAAVNWDSGYLSLADVGMVLDAFLQAAECRLAGMDVVGDWSPVRLRGLLRRAFHVTEHPTQTMTESTAAKRNERANLFVVHQLEKAGLLATRSASITVGSH
jgi:hypothetical protein